MSATPLPENPGTPTARSSVRPLLLLLIALCSFFIISYALRLDERDRMEAAIVQQQGFNDAARQRGAALQKELASATKRSHMDEIARTKLHLVRPNETRLIPVGGGSLAAAAEAPPVPTAPPPVWRQWVDFLFPRS